MLTCCSLGGGYINPVREDVISELSQYNDETLKAEGDSVFLFFPFINNVNSNCVKLLKLY